MSDKVYFENLFVKLYQELEWSFSGSFDGEDFNAATNFHKIITSGNQLTFAQGRYLIQLLKKYHLIAKANGVIYDKSLSDVVWKTPFRVLDTTKSVWVEEDDEKLWICFKFPYALKEEMEKEFRGSDFQKNSKYDYDKKIRKLDPYRFNIQQVNDFVEKFEIFKDASFVNLLDQVDEIWEQETFLLPRATIIDGSAVIVNGANTALDYFSEHQTGDINKDIFLLKSMGFPLSLKGHPTNLIEKICSTKEKTFWIDSLSKFCQIQKQIDGVSVVVLDRNTKDIVGWLKQFLKFTDDASIPRSDIRICFRESEKNNSVLNQWIKDNELGGKVKDGKIFVFLHKPAKWLFKEQINVKITLTNSFIPVNEPTTLKLLKSHPCNIIVSEIKPTESKDFKIVEL